MQHINMKKVENEYVHLVTLWYIPPFREAVSGGLIFTVPVQGRKLN